MVYTYRTGKIVPFVQKHYKLLILAVVALFLTSLISLTISASAAVQNFAGCDFEDGVAGTWSLQGDCTTTGPINVPANTIVEGNGYTINAGYTFGSNGAGTNTVIGVIDADNVTIKNLTIDGTGGTSLHGVNVYVSDDVLLDGVTIINNDKSGLVVNGSTVTVNNIVTSGNGWHAINVDLGSGVVGPAELTVNGVSKHTEFVQIYVDNTAEAVSVIDTESQYTYANNVKKPGDRLYTLKYPTSKEECKNNGWMRGLNPITSFRNQGDCVSYFATKGANPPTNGATNERANRNR